MIAPKVYTLTYIDDEMGMFKNQLQLLEVVAYLNQEFEITIGSPSCYLGLYIWCNYDLCTIYLDQTCYINTLHKFGYNQSKLVSTLADPNVQLHAT